MKNYFNTIIDFVRLAVLFILLSNIFFSIEIDTSAILKDIKYIEINDIKQEWKIYEGYAIKDKIFDYKHITETWISNGKVLLKVTIPPSPPMYNEDKSNITLQEEDAVIIDNVPASSWCFGCGPTAGQMLIGYYDRIGYENLYTGPTNNGLFPIDNSIWGTVEIDGAIMNLGPLSASMMGLDGRDSRGHVDDYW